MSLHAVLSSSAAFVTYDVGASVEAADDELRVLNTFAVIGHHTVIDRNTIISPEVLLVAITTSNAPIFCRADRVGCAMRGVGTDVYHHVKPTSTV